MHVGRAYIRHAPLLDLTVTPFGPIREVHAIEIADRGHQIVTFSRAISIPLGELGSEVALFQLEGGREFLSENPLGSDLYHLDGWKQWPNIREQ